MFPSTSNRVVGKGLASCCYMQIELATNMRVKLNCARRLNKYSALCRPVRLFLRLAVELDYWFWPSLPFDAIKRALKISKSEKIDTLKPTLRTAAVAPTLERLNFQEIRNKSLLHSSLMCIDQRILLSLPIWTNFSDAPFSIWSFTAIAWSSCGSIQSVGRSRVSRCA